MDLVIFEQNKPLVLKALGDGEFDYIEAASEVFETEFFRFIGAKKILHKLAESYPTPRKKEEVPLWFYVASNLSMRLHGVHSFHGYPMVVRTGGMLNAFGAEQGRKLTHPDTGDVTLCCKGFNDKNHYARETPCDQDFLRKMARDTDAEALMEWFSTDVVKIWRTHKAFDEEGIFIGDGSYLFVPDNPNYEGSDRLLFDENNHPVSWEQFEKMTNAQKSRCEWRRCYKMVTLLHTRRKRDFYLFVAVQVMSGKAHESPVLFELVQQFVETVGKGVMKRLILDRGFLDGEAISRCKKDYGIDVLIPVRRNMDIYEDAMALFQLPETDWLACEEPAKEAKQLPRPRPEPILKREQKRRQTLRTRKEAEPPAPPEKTLLKREAAAIGELRSWSSCTVPLTVIANREHYADGHQETWLLIDTKEVDDPRQAAQDYSMRIDTEERYRQVKCFMDLTRFSSPKFSIVVNQVVFIMLAYNQLQLFLLRQARSELNKKPPPYIRQQLLPSTNHIIVYWKQYYALLSPLELLEIIATLGDEARKKAADRSRRLQRELSETLLNFRPP